MKEKIKRINVFLICAFIAYFSVASAFRVLKFAIEAVWMNKRVNELILEEENTKDVFLTKDLNNYQFYNLIATADFINGNYLNAIIYYKKAMSKQIVYEDIIKLGLAYEKSSKIDSAIYCFNLASYYVPHKLLANYQLFHLYLYNLSDSLTAYNTALKIQKIQIKKQTKKSFEIKNEISSFIKNFRSNSKIAL